jgi:Zn finger protein HypA/HybF involved in hydrogenase expression
MTKRREIQRNWKWHPGQDPQDPDAYPGTPWKWVKYEDLLPKPDPKSVEPENLGGPDTEVECFKCHHNTYRIIGSKEFTEVTGYSIMREEYSDTKLMLICPNCHDRIQIYESVLKRIQHQKENQ